MVPSIISPHARSARCVPACSCGEGTTGECHLGLRTPMGAGRPRNWSCPPCPIGQLRGCDSHIALTQARSHQPSAPSRWRAGGAAQELCTAGGDVGTGMRHARGSRHLVVVLRRSTGTAVPRHTVDRVWRWSITQILVARSFVHRRMY